MIEEIRIRNFRHFEDVTFRPHEHTSLLCGLNGTGKSTIVELMHRLKRFVVDGQPVGALFGTADMPLWAKEVGEAGYTATIEKYSKMKIFSQIDFFHDLVASSPALDIILSTNNSKFRYVLCVLPLPEYKTHKFSYFEILYKHGEEIYTASMGNVAIIRKAKKEKYKVDPEISGIRLAAKANSDIQEFLQYIADNIFTLCIDPLAMQSRHEKPEDFLALNAHNFPAWYAHQVGTSLLTVTACFKEYAAFIPGFAVMVQDSRKTPVPLEANIKLSSEKSYILPFASFSHGQKVLCVLHTVIKLAPQGSTIFIDEFENYLAPTELVPLYCAMQDAFEERGVQFVLVSHHQKTLNWFRDSAFIFTFSKDNPTVQLTPFDAEKHGEIYEYLDELAGEQA